MALSTTSATPARADAATDRARARDAYDRATRAYDKGDYNTAAREYAEADLIAPTNASLEAALEAAIRADDPAQGQELVLRAATRTLDKSTTATVATARARFEGRAARILTECGAATTCVLSVDGVAKDPTRVLFVKHGPHTLVLQRDNERIERLVDVRQSSMVFPPRSSDALAAQPAQGAAPPTTPPSVPSTAPDSRKNQGLSPVWFYGGAGLTAALAGLTIASALDTVSHHDKFRTAGCVSGQGAVSPSCDGLALDGKSAELRTNVGVGVTAALAVTTATLGIFFVRWQKDETTRVSLGVRPGGAFVELSTP